MKKVSETDHAAIASALKSGGIVVLRTDTIYGIVTRAESRKNCDTIFAMKQRDADKSCIVLIANDAQMWDAVSRDAYQSAKGIVSDAYPTSLIVPIGIQTPPWIHHGKQDVAFRIPTTKPWLIKVLEETGPIIAPSANLQSEPPATNIDEAYAYFGNAVDLYVDGGTVTDSEPSHIYRLTSGAPERLR